MKTKVWYVLGGMVLTVVVIWGAARGLSSGVPVDAAAVKQGPIREFVDERAVTRLPETYLITMPANGRIEAITLHEGMAVNKGDVVARIVPRDLELAVEQATAAVDRLEASVRENADNSVEETGYQQTVQFVRSMKETVKAAKARMTSGEAKYAYAVKSFDRIQRLAKSGTKTQDDLELADLERVQSRVDFQQDQFVYAATVALEAATDLLPTMVRQYIDRKKLTEQVLQKQKTEASAYLQQILQDQHRGTMTSPVDGVVLKRDISNERFLSAGQTLLEIGRLEDLQIEADVLSQDVVDAKVGAPVKIYGPAIGKPPATGKVARIYPAGFTKVSSLGVEQQRVKVIIHFDDNQLERLRQQRGLGVGYRVRVQITTVEKPDALVVPRSALFRATSGAWQVYAVRNGRAKIQTVQVGLENDRLAEITSGLSVGEHVVLAPESSLTSETRVAISQQPEGTP